MTSLLSFPLRVDTVGDFPYLLQYRLVRFLSVHATISILLQIHISQASIFLVLVHVSHPYITTGKAIAFIILVFVSLLTGCFSVFFPWLPLRSSKRSTSPSYFSHPSSFSIRAPINQKVAPPLF